MTLRYTPRFGDDNVEKHTAAGDEGVPTGIRAMTTAAIPTQVHGANLSAAANRSSGSRTPAELWS